MTPAWLIDAYFVLLTLQVTVLFAVCSGRMEAVSFTFLPAASFFDGAWMEMDAACTGLGGSAFFITRFFNDA